MDARTRRIVGGAVGLIGTIVLARRAPDFVAAVLMTFSFVVFVLALVGLVKPSWVRLPNRLAVVWAVAVAFGMFVGGGMLLSPENGSTASSDRPPAPERTPAERGEVAALVRCPEHVERLAQFTSRWTDGMLEPKFSRSRNTTDPDVVTYLGDKIEFQTGFGAWQPHVYECDLNVETESVIDVRATPGRLPAQ